MKGKELIFVEAKIDITEYFPADSGMNLRIPVNFKIGDCSSVAILQVISTYIYTHTQSIFPPCFSFLQI